MASRYTTYRLQTGLPLTGSSPTVSDPASRSASVASYRFPVDLRGPRAQAAAVECGERSYLAPTGSARV
ncbi:unnamed protein product [Boreogadus saida]